MNIHTTNIYCIYKSIIIPGSDHVFWPDRTERSGPDRSRVSPQSGEERGQEPDLHFPRHPRLRPEAPRHGERDRTEGKSEVGSRSRLVLEAGEGRRLSLRR